jgi:hypothetical protein
LSAKTSGYGLLTRAAAVQVDLVIAELLNNLGSTSDLNRIVASNLANYRVLLLGKIKQSSVILFVNVDYCMFVQHLCVEECMLCQRTHEVSKIVVGDVHHWSD